MLEFFMVNSTFITWTFKTTARIKFSSLIWVICLDKEILGKIINIFIMCH